MYCEDVVLDDDGHSLFPADDPWKEIPSVAVCVSCFVHLMLQIHVAGDIFAADIDD